MTKVVIVTFAPNVRATYVNGDLRWWTRTTRPQEEINLADWSTPDDVTVEIVDIEGEDCRSITMLGNQPPKRWPCCAFGRDTGDSCGT